MDEDKVIVWLLVVIENLYMYILGYFMGCLFLLCLGYFIDYKKVIDVCVVNKVVIEINVSFYWLDLDWIWILYVLEKGVLLSINLDVYSCEGIKDIYFGILVV